MIFAEIVLSPQAIAICVLAAVCLAFAVGWLLRKDTKLEQRKREINKVVSLLRKMGGPVFEFLADALENIVIGDLSGFVEGLKQVHKIANNPAAVEALIVDQFKADLGDMLDIKEVRLHIFEEVEKWKLANPQPVAPAAPAAPTTAA